MTVLGYVGWWLGRGLIGWVIMAAIVIAVMVYWSLDDKRSDAMDKAVAEFPDTDEWSTARKVIEFVADFVVWPIQLIRFALDFAAIINNAKNHLVNQPTE